MRQGSLDEAEAEAEAADEGDDDGPQQPPAQHSALHSQVFLGQRSRSFCLVRVVSGSRRRHAKCPERRSFRQHRRSGLDVGDLRVARPGPGPG